MPNRFNDRENGESSYFPRGYTERHRHGDEDDFHESRQRRFESSRGDFGTSPTPTNRNHDPEAGYSGEKYNPGVDYQADSDERFQRSQNRNYENPQQRFSGRAEQRWYPDSDFSAGVRHSQYEQGPYFGRGPKGYRRSDERIAEDINERLTQHPFLDATEIVVNVQDGEVELSGTVEDRKAKRLAEDIAESVSGVKDVHNRIRMNRNNNQIR
jgi:osmotically-inducible protein OsmY